MKYELWKRDELILALNLYLKLPFGKLDARTKEVKELATIIGRTPGAVSMRLNNFASVDPFHIKRGIVGLANGRKVVEPIWNEFVNNRGELIFESERILAEKLNQNLEAKFTEIMEDLPPMKGEEKIRAVKTRVNQSVFRQMVLVNYSSRCVVSKIAITDLLVASHIIPWSKNEAERLNPENGLCLSAIHDRAFDKGLIGVDTDYRVLISKELREYSSAPFFDFYFGQFENKLIEPARKYLPRKAFLEYHLDHVFRK